MTQDASGNANTFIGRPPANVPRGEYIARIEKAVTISRHQAGYAAVTFTWSILTGHYRGSRLITHHLLRSQTHPLLAKRGRGQMEAIARSTRLSAWLDIRRMIMTPCRITVGICAFDGGMARNTVWYWQKLPADSHSVGTDWTSRGKRACIALTHKPLTERESVHA